VELEESRQEARVAVPADQLSLAIGKQGQNVRLAAKLTGWRIDVVSGDEKEEGAEIETPNEEKKDEPIVEVKAE